MKHRHSELYEGLLIPTGTRLSRPKLSDLAALLRIARRGNSIESLNAKATFEWIFTYACWLLVVLPALIYLWSDRQLAPVYLSLGAAAFIVNIVVHAGLRFAPWLTVRLDLLIRISELLIVSANVTLAHLVVGGFEFNAVYVVFLVIGAVGGGARRTLELSGIILFLMTASNTFAVGFIPGVTIAHALVNVAVHAAIFALTAITALFLFGRERQMSHYADTDALTGLFNRRAFYPTLLYVAVMANERRRPASLILCDLDLFKQVNDTYGHDMGDLVLKEFASRIRDCIPVPRRLVGSEARSSLSSCRTPTRVKPSTSPRGSGCTSAPLRAHTAPR